VTIDVVQTPGQSRSPVLVPLAGTGPRFADEILVRLREGWRCVRFEWCISLGVITLRRQSAVYLTATWQERYVRGAGYSLLALLFGPWGVPWGLVRTPWAVWVNLTGGLDVTEDVIRQLGSEAPDPPGHHGS
jgi:hypothetical protein